MLFCGCNSSVVQSIAYWSSSSLNRYVLQYTKLNSANTSGNVILEITSIRFDLEHFLLKRKENIESDKNAIKYK